jgi:hypothetical protein
VKKTFSVGGVLAVLLLTASILPAVPITDLTDTAQGFTPGPGPHIDAEWWVTGGQCPAGAANCTAGAVFPGDPFTTPTSSLSPTYVPLDGTIIPVGPFDPWVGSGVAGAIQGPFAGAGGGWIVAATRADSTIESSNPASIPPGGDAPLQFGGGVGNRVPYYYVTEFTLNPNFTDVHIDGFLWADGSIDSVCAIFLNGDCVGPNPFQTPQPHTGVGTGFVIDFATYGSSFQAGTNRLVFAIGNSGWESGLRVDIESDVTYDATTPEPSTYALFGAGLVALVALRRRRA